ncbi:hypothetical protein B484DRAFT_360217 [Ochromonadaceae sp. CCMP2298]|nr:hypothetical protein B484DRAFT_360217 [Ochromonadaceae sp. CCMP2298]
MSKCPTPVPYLVPANGLGEPFPHSLTFDSDFESGNLLRAVQKGDASYDLFLRSDLHTPGHTQWFYFAVANTHPPELVRLAEQGISVPPVRVRFNIVNFTKPDSLFNLGMRPVVYSVQDAQEKSAGWVRAGCDISYYGNSFQRSNAAGEGAAFYYTLSFTMEFQNPGDTMLIAYSYPYTVSDYRKYINETLDRPGASDVIRQSRLCYTLSGEDCDVLVITNFADREKERIGPISLKPALFVSARVHPGETPASWMMKGMLDFLTSGTSQAQLLRQAFVIFVVPMLNPDGVMYGNNRCSLAGVDLNRQWKTPIKGVHPTVHSLKLFMLGQRKLREVNMYIDLHGHSRKYNVFMYGCDDKKRPRPQVRAFPKFFSMHNVGKKYVSFADCSFTVKKGRESTARVVVAKEINIPLSFTLEATFCGSSYGPLKHCHMNTGHLQEVGAALCDAILNFSISEGQVKDALLVPANLKAVAQVEKAIAEGLDEEDLLTVRDKVGTKMQRSSSGVLETISARKLSTTVLVKVGMEGKVTHTTAFGQGVGSEMDGALVLSGGMGSVGSGCSSPHSGRMVDNASEEVEDVAGEAVLSSDVDGEGEAEEAADEEVGSGSEDDDDDDVEAVEGEEEDDASDAESLMGPLGMDPKRGDSLIIKRSKTVGDPPSPGTGTMPTIPASAQRSSSGPDGSSLGREKAKAMRLLANAPRKGEEDDDSTDLMFGGTNMVSLSLNGGGIGIADSLFKTTKKVKKKKVGSDKTGSDKNSAVSQKIRSGASSSAGGGGRKNARIKDLSSTMPIKGKVYADDFEVVEKRGPGGTIVKAEFEDMFFRQEADDSNSSLAKAQAAATTFGLPKVNGAQRQY